MYRPRLQNAHFFQQPAGRHPTPQRIEAGCEVLELVVAGRGWVASDGDWWEVLPGDLVWQCAGDQTIARSDFAQPYRCLALRFTVAPRAERPAPRFSRWDDVEACEHFGRRILTGFVDDQFPPQVLADYAYATLRYQAQRWQQRQRQSDLPVRLRQAVGLLERHYSDDWSVERLAQASGWSASQLHAAFRRYLQTTPHAYLVERRLRAARELLASVTDPIAAIGRRCGFNNPAHFARLFQRSAGMAPSIYRQRRAE